MADAAKAAARGPRTAARWIQWGSLALAIALLLVFLLSQRQTTDFLYGTQHVGSVDDGNDDASDDTAGSADGSTHEYTGTLPSDAALAALFAKSTIVRLPGAIATFDEPRVLAAIGHADQVRAQQDDPQPKIKVIVAPPDLSDTDEDRIAALPGDNLRIVGLAVTFAGYDIMPSDTDGWQQQFVTGDVTSLILSRLAGVLHEPEPSEAASAVQWRTPTTAELRTVVDGLGTDRLYTAPGADLDEVPPVAGQAFPTTPPIVVALPRQVAGEPVPDYAAALAQRFPDTPIIVMYGYWCSYAGPGADNTEVATASYYSRYGQLISENAYPQWNVLNVYLQQWARIRYAGLFDRPLPYQLPDPVGVALPVLPWLFLACVLVFLGASVHSARRRPDAAPGGDEAPADGSGTVPMSSWGRLAGLSSLAVELSGLADDRTNPRLARGVVRLTAAREALDADRSAAIVGSQLDAAQREFGKLADLLDRPDYRPEAYLAGRSS